MRRWFAAGDPQTTPRRFFEVLDRYELRDRDGKLKSDVGFVSMGDHFDFHGDVRDVERAGREILEWLLSHPSEQVKVLAGNHDVSRVMELAFETDASFAEARALADAVRQDDSRRREFHARFDRIPTPEIAERDYFSFSEAQRALVQRALLDGRMRLALVAEVAGEHALFTHAGVTNRELGLLGFAAGSEPDVEAIAAALEARLDRALADVRETWTRGERAALDLSPIHVPGTREREGGGLLYHRPTRADRPKADPTWELAVDRPRRFEPQALPRHLVQVVGHSPHPRFERELEGWVDESAKKPHLALRTLVVPAEGEPRYRAGVDARPGNLVLIDPGFAKAPLETIELLPIEAVSASSR